nr:ATP synthase F0 subunit 8 [Pseudoglomeris magnifica]
MPQMMPLNWMILYFLFIITMLTFSIMNYYLFINKPKTSKKNLLLTKNYWKW